MFTCKVVRYEVALLVVIKLLPSFWLLSTIRLVSTTKQ
jgi:hypothetical protein